MANIACIMMQRNEDLLLELWIAYHGYLFGFENLYVFDNGSTSQKVDEVLLRYEAVGIKVIRDRNSPKDFDNKGWLVGNLIKDMQNKEAYDFFLPLDCDEFVALAGSDGFTTRRNEIGAYFDKRKGVDSVLRVTHSLVNLPGSVDTFALIDHCKSIIPSGNFRSLDHGFHEAELLTGKTFLASDILHVHMHNKPFAILLQHAKDKLRPFVDVDDKAALSNYNGVGVHLVPYFFDYEERYFRRFAASTRFHFHGLKQFAHTLHFANFVQEWTVGAPPELHEAQANFVPDPRFTAVGYNEANPDVVKSGMNAVLHYYLFGHREGRRLVGSRDLRRSELNELGVSAIRERNWTNAAHIWSRYRDAYPEDPEGYAMGVLIMRESGCLEEADAFGAAAIKRFHWYERLYREWTLITFAKRDWIEARKRCRVLRERFPAESEGYIRGSAVARELGEEEEALRLLAQLALQSNKATTTVRNEGPTVEPRPLVT